MNVDHESQKAGALVTDVEALAQQIAQLPRLQLRGLMGLPQADQSEADTLQSFQALATLFHKIQHLDSQIDTLSMGMSNDMELAIRAGSNMIRIGTALFGARQYPQRA